MKGFEPKVFTVERQQLEQAALEAVCACWYYDFADCINEITDAELEQIVTGDGVECPNCY